MKYLKTIIILILSLLLTIPRIIVWILNILEGVVRVIKNTINFFIEQIVEEFIEKETFNNGTKKTKKRLSKSEEGKA